MPMVLFLGADPQFAKIFLLPCREKRNLRALFVDWMDIGPRLFLHRNQPHDTPANQCLFNDPPLLSHTSLLAFLALG